MSVCVDPLPPAGIKCTSALANDPSSDYHGIFQMIIDGTLSLDTIKNSKKITFLLQRTKSIAQGTQHIKIPLNDSQIVSLAYI